MQTDVAWVVNINININIYTTSVDDCRFIYQVNLEISKHIRNTPDALT